MAFYRFTITSNLSPEAAAGRLGALVRPSPGIVEVIADSSRMGRNIGVPFTGEVENGSFRIQRDIRYGNSFLPKIRGKIHENGVGSELMVTMHIHPLVAAFLLIWFGGLGFIGFMIVTRSKVHSLSEPIPFGMFLTCRAECTEWAEVMSKTTWQSMQASFAGLMAPIDVPLVVTHRSSELQCFGDMVRRDAILAPYVMGFVIRSAEIEEAKAVNAVIREPIMNIGCHRPFLP